METPKFRMEYTSGLSRNVAMQALHRLPEVVPVDRAVCLELVLPKGSFVRKIVDPRSGR